MFVPLSSVLIHLPMVQVIEGRDQVDWKRHSVFVTFGFFYLVSLLGWMAG